MEHIMVDLETMGTAPDSPILSIGAVCFDPIAGIVSDAMSSDAYYRAISLRDSIDAGFRADGDTIVWWMKQSDDARNAAISGKDHPAFVLNEFFTWFRKMGGKFIWSYGANFDEVLLSTAAHRLGQIVPWKYGDVRCARTVLRLADVQPDRSTGTHHNALHDAVTQAHSVLEAYRKLSLIPGSAAGSIDPVVKGA